LARDGRTRVEQHYSWDRVAEKTYDLFQRVVKGTEALIPAQGLEFASLRRAD
jgi:hypothetical protein